MVQTDRPYQHRTANEITDPISRKLTISNLIWKTINFPNVFQEHIPFGPVCKADIRNWADLDRAINTGRNNYQSTLRLNGRKSRPAFDAEASFVSGLWNPISLNAITTRNPIDLTDSNTKWRKLPVARY